ncbi:type IV pilus modification protein PilV [Marinicellulosiphila megalodicopiae]|uniref:type IV pilus modification protein PilV n=1 Tax=Marinicellulosiphila megalodicopiae TaxID=2724896 RepID=UPI003BB1B493
MQLNHSLLNQTGTGLIEIMVAVLIISVSLLGLGALLNASLQTNQAAYARTTAATLIYDVADRIRANPTQDYSVNLTYTPPETEDTSCEVNSCSPIQMRNYDINQWLQLLQTNLTNGDASIRMIGESAIISMVWLSSSDPSEEDTNESLQIQVNI